MPHHRYYAPTALQPNERVTLSADEWHHLAHVLRGKKGDVVELINGSGILAQAKIEEITKKEAILLVEARLQEELPPLAVILALALSRMNHLEWAIEKATELGATALWLFPGMLSEKPSLSAQQESRLGALILAATKQCGRLHLPALQCKPPLAKWSSLEGSLFLCQPTPQAPYLWQLPLKRPLPAPIIFFIGPEKGFAPQELQFLKTSLKAKEVRLHPHTLRTETAPLVALSLIQPALE